MPTAAEARLHTAAHAGSLRLDVDVRAGARDSVIELEPGHCERFFRMATHVALRDAALAPGEPVRAAIVPGRVRERHGDVVCLDSFVVALFDDADRVVIRVEFPRRAFSAFAALRGIYLLAAAERVDGKSDTAPAVSYSLHGRPCDDEPVAVALPDLTAMSLATLIRHATAHGTPDDEWIATVATEEAIDGFATLEHASRERGVEVAAHVRTRIGFDPTRRCFVRILERVMLTESGDATATSVVSSAASWAPLLAEDARDRGAFSSAHTHLHLGDIGPHGDAPVATIDAAADVDRPRVAESLDPASRPVVSITDLVTHYQVFQDSLASLCIVSVFPERTVLTIHGYMRDAVLREEPGYWVLPARSLTSHDLAPRPRRSRRRASTPRMKGPR